MKKLLKAMSAIIIIAALVFCTTTVQAASKKLATPKNVKTSISGTSNVKVTWTKVSKAKKYTIYRATSSKGKYTKIATTKSTSYTDKTTKRGKTYYYKVVANAANSKQNSSKSAAAKVTVPSKSKALKEIKKALKDTKWVNKNLRMKKNVFGEKVNSDQTHKLTFKKIKGKELVLVQEYDNELSVQGYLVGYTNGKVTVKTISKNPMNASRKGIVVAPNNAAVSIAQLNQSYVVEEATFYKVSDVKFTKQHTFYENISAGVYKVDGKKVSKSKYSKALNPYSKYKWVAVDTSLTAKNIDKYVK